MPRAPVEQGVRLGRERLQRLHRRRGYPAVPAGSKMASHGDDWQTNPATQIRWGLDYISQVYGSPCSAWGHSQSVGWY